MVGYDMCELLFSDKKKETVRKLMKNIWSVQVKIAQYFVSNGMVLPH